MVLFLLLSSPLAVLAAMCIALAGSPGDANPSGAHSRGEWSYLLVRYAVMPGIFLFVVMYLGSIIFKWFIPYHYSPGGLFLYHTVTDFLLWGGMAIGGALFVRRRIKYRSREDRHIVMLVFVGIVFSLLSATDLILHDGYWTTYQLLLRPLARSGMVLLFPLIISLSFGSKNSFRGQWFWIIPLIYIPGWGLAAMWSEWLRPVHAGFAALVLSFVTAGFLFSLARRDQVSV